MGEYREDRITFGFSHRLIWYGHHDLATIAATTALFEAVDSVYQALSCLLSMSIYPRFGKRIIHLDTPPPYALAPEMLECSHVCCHLRLPLALSLPKSLSYVSSMPKKLLRICFHYWRFVQNYVVPLSCCAELDTWLLCIPWDYVLLATSFASAIGWNEMIARLFQM